MLETKKKKKKRCERLVYRTLHLLYFDQRDAETKPELYLSGPLDLELGIFFSPFQMTTKKVGPQLVSESNILVTQMANGVMKGRLGRFVFLKESSGLGDS